MEMETAENQVWKREHVFIGQDFSSKEDCLRFIADKAVKLGLCNDSEVTYEGFLFRESQGPTGLEDGFAIPHTRCNAVVKSGVILVKTKEPVEWDSMDDKPVQVMIALIVPNQDGNNEHIRLLASLSRMLIKKDFRESLKASGSEEEIFHILSEVMN